jgi:hypothetical protein
MKTIIETVQTLNKRTYNDYTRVEIDNELRKIDETLSKRKAYYPDIHKNMDNIKLVLHKLLHNCVEGIQQANFKQNTPALSLVSFIVTAIGEKLQDDEELFVIYWYISKTIFKKV